MLKNKSGQAVFIGIMMFIMVFITLVQFIQPIKEVIVDSRSSSNLDCANSSISFGRRSTCVIVDSSLFYFFGTGLAAAAALLGGRFIFEKVRS